jgi:hypothetical protein
MHADAVSYIDSIDALADREAAMLEQQAIEQQVTEPQAPRLTPVSLDGFMAHAPQIQRYVIAGLVPLRHVTLLSAHGGSGKSQLAIEWCAHVACGHPWAGRTVRGPAKAVFVSLEDEASLVLDRLRRIVDEYSLDEGMVGRNVRIFDGTGTDGAMVVEVAGRRLVPTAIMAEVEAASVGAALVVIDNASDAFAGDEINRRQVRAFVSHLATIARDADAGMLLLAHIDKMAAKYGAAGNSYSGSTAWHNSARSRLALVDTNGFLELLQEKLNLGKLSDPIPLKFTDAGVIVPGRANPEQVSADADARSKADTEAVLGLLEIAEKAGITVPTATSGPVTAWHALDPLPEFPGHFRTKDGRRQFFASIVRLARSGAIVKATYKTAARHIRDRWELAHDWRKTHPEAP